MPTTIASSELAGGSSLNGRVCAAACTTVLCLLVGCATHVKPEEFFQLTPESPAHTAVQTRYFETSNERELLSASAAVLQDLGFQVSESSREVGFLRAAKERSARQWGQEITRFLVAMVSVVGMASARNTLILLPVDLHQQINAALVTQPIDGDGSRHRVRVVFYRIVWKGAGQSGNQSIPPGKQKMEMILHPEIYQEFFARLSKAVFLEAHKI